MYTAIVWLLISLICLWVGSSIAVKAVTTLSRSFKVSSFFVSFFILGLFTSITEISVGVTALLENQPEVYVGDLLGSSVVVYLLVIPLLAIAGNGIKLNHSFKFRDLIATSLIVAMPSLLTLDNNFSLFDAFVCVSIYAYLIILVNKRANLLEKILHEKLTYKTISINIIKILVAVSIIVVGSHILIQQIPNLGQLLGISPFIVSIIIVSLGTNIPELTIAVRSIISNQKEIALGDYLGSAALNTFEIGVLTILGNSTVRAEGSNFSIIVFVIALFAFICAMKSKNSISRTEGALLLIFYLAFIFFEIRTGPGWFIR